MKPDSSNSFCDTESEISQFYQIFDRVLLFQNQ